MLCASDLSVAPQIWGPAVPTSGSLHASQNAGAQSGIKAVEGEPEEAADPVSSDSCVDVIGYSFGRWGSVLPFLETKGGC